MRSLTYQQKNVHRFHLLRNCLRISQIIFFCLSLFRRYHVSLQRVTFWNDVIFPLKDKIFAINERVTFVPNIFYKSKTKPFQLILTCFFSVVPHTHIYTCLEFHYRHFLQLCTSGKLHEHITFFGAVYMIFNEKK